MAAIDRPSGDLATILPKVCDRVAELTDEPEPVSEFTKVFLTRAPGRLEGRGTDKLARMALGAWHFLRDTQADRVDVAIADARDEGWDEPVSVVRTNITERPFIIDTVREFLNSEGSPASTLIYPRLGIERDQKGRLLRAGAMSGGGSAESMIHCEIPRVRDAGRAEELCAEIKDRLNEVVQVTDDFTAMIAKVDAVSQELMVRGRALMGREEEIAEIGDFLRWLRDGGFVFLGYRAYTLTRVANGERAVAVVPDSGLGILRDPSQSKFSEPVPLSALPDDVRDLAERGPLLIINKTNAESRVHRRARMDYVGIKTLDDRGRVAGEHRFIGLFTSRAYSEKSDTLPILRRKLTRVVRDSGAVEGTHDYKEIVTIFNTLPKEELFLESAYEIGAAIRLVLAAYDTSDVRVTVREDPLKRGMSVMVILPKDRFSGEVRKRIEEAIVEELHGDVLNYHLALGEGDQARLHFYVVARDHKPDPTVAVTLEARVARIIRTWADHVREGLATRLGSDDDAHNLARRYEDAFAAEYQAATDPETAVDDILEIEGMVEGKRPVAISLTNRDEGERVAGVSDATELKVLLRGGGLVLSEFVPILEYIGLRVLAVKPFELSGDDGRVTINVFAVQDYEGNRINVDERGKLLADTVLAARAGAVRSDSLNALVLLAGLKWREVDVLRGYSEYASQIGAIPTRDSLVSALSHYPGIARTLFALFRARFDPKVHGTLEERREEASRLRVEFQDQLTEVRGLADDRALRHLESLISATVRTNYYRHGGSEPTKFSGGAPYVSLKFDCAATGFHAGTGLRTEVWVHSARMEGVHLRGGAIARGGIRWSDRREDFRTEVLGLATTQMVKNAMIVPGGSKGGFVTTTEPPDDHAMRLREGRRQYRTLIRGLLDLTDNLVDGEPRTPPNVVAHDEFDPYLVVAADKGTATFSDMANEVAAEYGFWLGDAFASGGSCGYDHKEVGITARGAWECVKLHFRERGKDIETEPLSVVGIGDMGGDVFGNGMLLSERISLVAAFNHRHIFIDPDPDPAASFAERARLFGLGSKATWDDFDRSKLSDGGMIVPRGVKGVHLSPEVRRALGVPEKPVVEGDDGPAAGVTAPETVDGEGLVRMLLRAPVELLWNGGIGTYVKASTESHADAGDPANDAVRINANELRCSVVGEGGNLGLTQSARVEFALLGGRLNTDALDNSGGVDMSDHEVNLKILLAPAVVTGKLNLERRNLLLEEMTDRVAELVLTNNRSQSMAVSLDALRAAREADDFRNLMFALEKQGLLDRLAERLPSVDVLRERLDRGQSLVRPELCVLLAYSKMALTESLLASDLLEDPSTTGYLLSYFPPDSLEAAGEDNLDDHRLRREIVTCQLTNQLVDLMGSAFVNRVTRDTGRTASEVVSAWIVASGLSNHTSLVDRLTSADGGMASRQVRRWLLGLSRVLERTTRWVLANIDLSGSPALIVERNREGLARLRSSLGEIVAGDDRTLFRNRVSEARREGASEAFADELTSMRFLDHLLEIIAIGRDAEADVIDVGRAYYEASDAFDLPRLRTSIFASAGDNQWEQRAAHILGGKLAKVHRDVVTAAVRGGGTDVPSVGRFLIDHERKAERFQVISDELRVVDEPGIAALFVAVQELATLVGTFPGMKADP